MNDLSYFHHDHYHCLLLSVELTVFLLVISLADGSPIDWLLLNRLACYVFVDPQVLHHDHDFTRNWRVKQYLTNHAYLNDLHSINSGKLGVN